MDNQILELLQKINGRLDTMEEKMDKRFDEMDKRFDEIESSINEVQLEVTLKLNAIDHETQELRLTQISNSKELKAINRTINRVEKIVDTNKSDIAKLRAIK